MPGFFYARKDVIDLRPIPIDGPKNYSYRWKMMALLEYNEKGQYLLPFSKRVIDIPSLLWPRSEKQPLPKGFELCGCQGCENKTWEDHIFNDDDDDEVSACGNLQLDYKPYNIDDENTFSDQEQIQLSEYNADNELDSSYEPTISSSLSTLEFPCGDPYESCDLEC